MSAFEDRFVSTFCKTHVSFRLLLNRVSFLSKYARKVQLKYVQLVVVVVVAAAAVGVVVAVGTVAAASVVVILNVDQK